MQLGGCVSHVGEPTCSRTEARRRERTSGRAEEQASARRRQDMDGRELGVQTMKSVFGLLLISAGLLAALPASAQDYDRSGFYIGYDALGVVSPIWEEDLDGPFSNVDIPVDYAWAIYAGIRVLPALALELEFDSVPDQTIEISGARDVKAETWVATFNTKIFILQDRIQPYVVLGLGAQNVDLSRSLTGLGGTKIGPGESDFVGRVGAGVEYYLTEMIVVNVGFDEVIGTGALENVDLFTFGGGLQLRF